MSVFNPKGEISQGVSLISRTPPTVVSPPILAAMLKPGDFRRPMRSVVGALQYRYPTASTTQSPAPIAATPRHISHPFHALAGRLFGGLL